MEISHRSNNFDFLRILAASLVIISHSFPIIGLPELKIVSVTLGGLGVYIFFIISGFLISQSWNHDRKIKCFIWKRFLRIIPALIFASVIVTLILGPLVTLIPLINYFTDLQTYKFFFFAMFFPFWSYLPFDSLPGVFQYNPFPFAVNGPLWTLVYEWAMYFILLILGIVGIIYHKISQAIILIFFTALFLFISYFSFEIPNKYIISQLIVVVPLFLVFFISSFIFFHHKKQTYSLILFLILISFLIISSFTNYFTISLIITLPFIVLFIAHCKIPYLNNIGKYGDYSYGLYIFAWPIQQTLVMYLSGISILYFIICCFLGTFPIAFISWHLIESKAMMYKNKLPNFKKFFFIRNEIKQDR